MEDNVDTDLDQAMEVVSEDLTSEDGTDLEETAAPDTEQEEQEEVEQKSFTQEELNEIVEKRLARERRKFEREQKAATDAPPLKIDSQLDPDDFATTEAYITALADERAEALIAHREKTSSERQIEENYQNQVDELLEEHPDYIQVAHGHPYMTNEMASAIKTSDIGAKLAYHLGANLKEAERIFNLNSVQQIKELGKLEVKLSEAKPAKRISKTPNPINPLQGSKTNVPVYDTTDPRSAKTMTAAEWIAKDRARRGYKE